MFEILKKKINRFKTALTMTDTLLEQKFSLKSKPDSDKPSNGGYAGGIDYLPDIEYEQTDKLIPNPVLQQLDEVVDATLFEVKFTRNGMPALTEVSTPTNPEKRKVLDYKLRRYLGDNLKEVLSKGEEHSNKLRESQLKEDWNDPDFNNNIISQATGVTEYIPQMMGPFFRQLYITDYLSMHAKAYEQWNHNPIAKRIVKLLTQYSMGKRVKWTSKSDEVSDAFSDFWRFNQLDQYFKFWKYERYIYGELMIRKFIQNGQPVVRSIDPATIWEIIHDPEDVQQVYYYHQQYPCLAGETKISLLDGTEKTVEELAKADKPYEVYSYDPKSRKIVAGLATKTWKAGLKRCVRITLDSGDSVTCSFDHPFLMRDGSYRWAEKLKTNDSLMPLYRRKGYEQVWQPTTGWEFTHHAVCGKPEKGYAVHHINSVKTDNRSVNLENLKKDEHDLKHHLQKRLCMAETVKPPSQKGKKYSEEHRRKMSISAKKSWTVERKQKASKATQEQWGSKEQRELLLAGMKKQIDRIALEAEARKSVNHKVVSVEEVGIKEVYDIQVEKYHNFGLSIGVFTHNTPYFQYYGLVNRDDPKFKNLPPASELLTKYIIRQIPADKILHYKTNIVSVERRGRSELFPILGWLKRVKDLANSAVIKSQLQAAFIWDDEINGNAADISAHLQKFKGIPRAASVFAHNKQIKRTPMEAKTGYSNDSGAVWSDIVSLIASSCGIPKEHLNIVAKGGGSRATALIGSEPFTKVIEDSQVEDENMLLDIADWVMKVKGIKGYKRGDLEFIFPSVTKDTTSEKIKNLLIGLNAQAITHQQFCTNYAAEMDLTGYDYEETQQDLGDEKKKGIGPVSPTEQPPDKPIDYNSDISDDPIENPEVPDENADNKGGSDIQGQGKADLKKNLNRI